MSDTLAPNIKLEILKLACTVSGSYPTTEQIEKNYDSMIKLVEKD